MLRIAFAVFLFGLPLSALAQSDDGNKITAEYGKTVRIPADFSIPEDESPVTVVWKRGDETIAMWVLNVTTYNEPRALLDDRDFSLRLGDLKFGDAGEYRVDGNTRKNTYEGARKLEILASPDVTVLAIPVLEEDTGVERLVAECTAARGSDFFSVSWYDGESLLANGTAAADNVNTEKEFLPDYVLGLSMAVDPRSDNGRVVTCVVTDAFGREIKENVTLIVTETTTTVPTTTIQAAPLIIKFPRDEKITLVLGKSRGMTCRATGVPEPRVYWYKDGTMIDSGIGESKIEILAKYSESGIYSCIARNGDGDDKKELTIDIQGPPIIVGADDLENGTENYALKTGEEFVNLLCESDAFPAPDIKWSVEGASFDDLEKSQTSTELAGQTYSYLNISARHFAGENAVSKVICTAKNQHGNAQKAFTVTVPISSSNAGVIVGVTIFLLLVLIAIIAVTIYCLVARKRQGSMATNPESGGSCPLSACCGGSKVKSKELKEEHDIVTVEHVKEVDEEGTHEEKQKLTAAEETPAKEEHNGEEPKEGEEEGGKKDDENPKKKKSKILLPMQCCKGDKKEKVAETEEGEVAEGEENEAGNGKTQLGEENEKDSGKGDTLEKVIEEDAAQK